MLDYYSALAQILADHSCKRLPDTISLEHAHGQVLAKSVHASFATPLFDNSAMDGYALCDPDNRLHEFTLVARTQAGEMAAAALQPGQAVRIFTGAALPEGATTVVMQENVEIQGQKVLAQSVKPGENIRRRAEEIQAGDLLLSAGTRLNAPALGLLATQGAHEVSVFKKLRVVVFSSGDELVEPGTPLLDHTIYESNQIMLRTLIQSFAHVQGGGILKDDFHATEAALKQAAEDFDVIVTTGGASVGEADYLKQALTSIGTLTEHKIAIKPGKPFGWGEIGQARVFVLPGNPVSAYVTAALLLWPALRQLAGFQAASCALPTICARAEFSTRKAIGRREFLRARLNTTENGLTVDILPNQGSAMLSSCVTATVLAEVPPDTLVQPGDMLCCHLLPDTL